MAHCTSLTVTYQKVRPNFIGFENDCRFQIVYIQAGRAIHHYGSESYAVEKGDLLAVGPSIPHGYTVQPGQELSVITVSFDVEALGDTLADPAIVSSIDLMARGNFQSGYSSGLFRPVPNPVHTLIDEIAKEFNAETVGFQTACHTLLRLMLVELYRHREPSEAWEAHRTSMGTIMEVLPLIHTMAISQSVSVSKIAEAAALSPGYFNRKFKQFMGETVSQYIQRIRVSKAIELLTTTNWAIEEIAFHVGYRDPGTFRAVFRRIVGSSPNDFRRRNQPPSPGCR